MHSIGSTPIFLKEVSESLYMVLCQIISTWTVVFHKALALDLYYLGVAAKYRNAVSSPDLQSGSNARA